jgi:uncharacterized protein YjbJ (UPF0337 family)
MKMDREHLKGAADKAKGAIKDTAGKMTGDTKMQAEGKIDKAKGAARKVAGDVKDAARDATAWTFRGMLSRDNKFARSRARPTFAIGGGASGEANAG